MARFILDVANLDEDGITDVINLVMENLSDKVTSIHCVDGTNTNQFHTEDDRGSNHLTKKQIDTHNIFSEL